MYEYGFPSFKNSGTKVYVCFDGRQNFQSQFQYNCLCDVPLRGPGVAIETPSLIERVINHLG